MKPAVHLKTKLGHTFYLKTWEQFEEAKEICAVEAFKALLLDQRTKVEKELILFLDDDNIAKQYKMDETDDEGWQYYNEASDQFSVLNHFYNRKA